jgi:amino acid permease
MSGFKADSHAVGGVTLYSPLIGDDIPGSLINEFSEKHDVDIEHSLLNKASSFSCYVCLANTIMGAGMLGLPYAFAKAGWLLGTFLMCFCAASSFFALHELSICAAKTSKPSSFYSVAMLAAPRYVWLIDFAVAIKCFGVATSYLIIVGGLMPEAMSQMGGSTASQSRELWIGIAFAIVGPIAFLNSLEALKFTSSLSVFFVGFLALVIVLFAAHAGGLDPCGDVEVGESCVGAKVIITEHPMGVLQILSIFVFAFTCHQNTFPVVNELENPQQSRVDRVLGSAIGTALAVFMTVNIAAFVTYGDAVESNVLQAYPGTISFITTLSFSKLLV